MGKVYVQENYIYICLLNEIINLSDFGTIPTENIHLFISLSLVLCQTSDSLNCLVRSYSLNHDHLSAT